MNVNDRNNICTQDMPLHDMDLVYVISHSIIARFISFLCVLRGLSTIASALCPQSVSVKLSMLFGSKFCTVCARMRV